MFLIGLGLLGVSDTVLMLAIAAGINLGTLLPGAAGFPLMVWALFTRRSPLNFSSLRRWGVNTIFFLVLCSGAVSFIAVQVLILEQARGSGMPESTWCILFGAGLRHDRPSLTLQRRIDTACSYLARHPRARVVVSGGRGRNETITEAEGMRRALVKKGVASSRIFLEEQASSTLENLRYSQEVIRATGGAPERVVAITSDFHALRVRLLARRVGMNVWCVPAPTPWYLLPNVCLREYFALIKSFLVDW